jgi:hypothetical protein
VTAAVALLLLACSRKESTPARSGDCGDCHVQETAEWNSSLHHSSFTDKDFQASFAVEPEKFCFDCHAPLASARGDTAGDGKMRKRVEHDLWYVDNWSPLLDLRILWLTIFSRKAYRNAV